ncbi:uncharacterized protein LOC128231795 [Mya arenaria]|uniref:uncharacterized protein LOC128231795 n=1 Tax=Mya arenaria TaxID=6604 RepID=UPI0022E762CD|nr:uncharacterized protein LOC128231795 [Mya arenaria]
MFGTVVIILTFAAPAVASPCAMENRTSQLTDCLQGIGAALKDTSAFWFGESYRTRCPPGSEISDLQCTNSRLDSNDSVMTRMFETQDGFDVTKLDRTLDLNYTSIGRNYSGCGTTYVWDGEEMWTHDVDPLAGDVEHPWYLRDSPMFHWDVKAGEENSFFTLVIYDVGYPVYHGVYINIPGNNISAADVIDAYHGPKVSTSIENPYLFLLYKHSARVTPPQELLDEINPSSWGNAKDYDLKRFAEKLGFTDPVAANWVVATGDTYAANYMAETVGLFNCPIFATKALHEKPRPFIPPTASLSVWLDVHMSTEDLSFVACCKNFIYEAYETFLDPIGNRIFNSAHMRTEANVTYTMRKAGFPGQTFGPDELYALVTFDPDVPSATVGTEEKPLLHGLVVNIRNGSVPTGDEVLRYSGPSPPDQKPHFYYFLLYRQSSELNATLMSTYSANNARYLFDINRLVSEQSLTLVGASWFRATTDPYTITRVLGRDSSQSESLCATIPGGKPEPCPTSAASTLPLSGALPFTTLALMLMATIMHV